MAYDEGVAKKIRKVLAKHGDVTEKKMFGGLALMLQGKGSRVYAADAPPPQYPGPYPVDLRVGELFVVAKSVEIVRPVRFPVCDDIKVVDVVDTPDGLSFKGVAPGKTLCSVVSGATMAGTVGPRGSRQSFRAAAANRGHSGSGIVNPCMPAAGRTSATRTDAPLDLASEISRPEGARCSLA